MPTWTTVWWREIYVEAESHPLLSERPLMPGIHLESSRVATPARSSIRFVIHLDGGGFKAAVKQVCCGFDADPTGDDMARAMIALHPQVRRLRPRLADWNDVLRDQP